MPHSTLLNFSPSVWGKIDFNDLKPALILCILLRSLLFATSLLILRSSSRWPWSSFGFCKPMEFTGDNTSGDMDDGATCNGDMWACVVTILCGLCISVGMMDTLTLAWVCSLAPKFASSWLIDIIPCWACCCCPPAIMCTFWACASGLWEIIVTDYWMETSTLCITDAAGCTFLLVIWKAWPRIS